MWLFFLSCSSCEQCKTVKWQIIFSVPDEFSYDPISKTHGEPQRRPEVRSSTIEFIAPSEYMVSVILLSFHCSTIVTQLCLGCPTVFWWTKSYMSIHAFLKAITFVPTKVSSQTVYGPPWFSQSASLSAQSNDLGVLPMWFLWVHTWEGLVTTDRWVNQTPFSYTQKLCT